MNRLFYLDNEDLDLIFDIIYSEHTGIQTVPDYRSEAKGIDKLNSLLDSLRLDYYPTFIDKAERLLIEICLGHFFYNGNKRLALVSFTIFLLINEYDIGEHTTDGYRQKIIELFPNYTFAEEGAENLETTNFGYYHIAVIIADHDKYTKSHDELKAKIHDFLTYSIIEPTQH